MAKLNRSKIPDYTPAEGINPLCPHCEGELEGVYRQEIDQSFGKAFVWFCMRCRKTLGVSHRKGFWMG